jgi:hypothetical protein
MPYQFINEVGYSGHPYLPQKTESAKRASRRQVNIEILIRKEQGNILCVAVLQF